MSAVPLHGALMPSHSEAFMRGKTMQDIRALHRKAGAMAYSMILPHLTGPAQPSHAVYRMGRRRPDQPPGERQPSVRRDGRRRTRASPRPGRARPGPSSRSVSSMCSGVTVFSSPDVAPMMIVPGIRIGAGRNAETPGPTLSAEHSPAGRGLSPGHPGPVASEPWLALYPRPAARYRQCAFRCQN